MEVQELEKASRVGLLLRLLVVEAQGLAATVTPLAVVEAQRLAAKVNPLVEVRLSATVNSLAQPCRSRLAPSDPVGDDGNAKIGVNTGKNKRKEKSSCDVPELRYMYVLNTRCLQRNPQGTEKRHCLSIKVLSHPRVCAFIPAPAAGVVLSCHLCPDSYLKA